VDLFERLLETAAGCLRSPQVTVATVDGFQGNEWLGSKSVGSLYHIYVYIVYDMYIVTLCYIYIQAISKLYLHYIHIHIHIYIHIYIYIYIYIKLYLYLYMQ
jgi:hypothetical protein